MTLDTLIEILTDYRDEFGGDAEVRLMTQQNWPFENRICGVTSGRCEEVSPCRSNSVDPTAVRFQHDTRGAAKVSPQNASRHVEAASLDFSVV